jgi:hypothetical protein
VVAYQGADPDYYGMAVVGTVSGGNITYGSAYAFNTGRTEYPAVSALSATQFVVAYQDQGHPGSYGMAAVGTVSGGDIAYGSKHIFAATGAQNIAVSTLSATQFVIAYAQSGHGTAVVGTVSGDDMTWNNRTVFSAARTTYITPAALSTTQFLVAYVDIDIENYGTANVYQSLGQRLIGIAKDAATSGETVPVIIGGVSDVHSGLTPGEMYYLQGGGSLGTRPLMYRVGLAISSSELLLDPLR